MENGVVGRRKDAVAERQMRYDAGMLTNRTAQCNRNASIATHEHDDDEHH